MNATSADIATVFAGSPTWRRVAHVEARPRVVVVSHSNLVRFRVRRELRLRGFEIVEANELNGPIVVRAAEGADAVVVDSAITQSCRYVVQSLRSNGPTRRIPVLLLTSDTPDARRDVLAVGADGLLSDTDDFDVVAAALSLHLR